MGQTAKVQLQALPATTASEPKTSVFRSILRDSGLYLFTNIAARVVSILLLPVSTHYLSTADYGVLDLIDQVNNVLCLLLGGGLGSAFSFFFFKKDAAEYRRQVVGTSVAGAFMIGLITGIIGWLAAEPISSLVFATPVYAKYLRLLFVGMPLSFLLEACFSWMRADDRMGAYVGLNLLRLLFTVAGIVTLLAVLKLGVSAVLYTTVGSLVVLCTFAVIYCARKVRPSVHPPLFTGMFRYSLPLGFSGIAMFFIHFGDRFILTHYRPMSEVGVYGTAYKIAMMITLVYSSFHTYWSAHVFEIVRREDGREILRKLITYLVLTLSVSSLFLLVAVRPALTVLTTGAFRAAAEIVPLILLAYCIRSIGDFFRCLFLAAGRPGLETICNFAGAALCGAAYYLLIPAYGMWGAATATLITFICLAVMAIVISYRLHPYEIEGVRIAKVLGSVGVPVAAYYLFPVRSLPLQIGWGVLLFASFPLLLLALRFPTPGERNSAVAAIRRYARLPRPAAA